MDMAQYLDVFIEESREHLQACNNNLLNLEKNPEDLSIINEVFRSAHTLKGMSATMGFEDMANLTHQMENVLDGIRNGKFPVTSELLDTIFLAVDALESMVESIASGGDGKMDIQEIVSQLKAVDDKNGKGPKIESARDVKKEDTPEGRLKLIYDTYEITVLEQSFEQGYSAYEVTVTLRPDCLLKSARIYMVFNVLEKAGEIIKSEPPVEELEDEKIDREFRVTIISKSPADDLKQMVLKVSEIERVQVVQIRREDLKEQQQDMQIRQVEDNHSASPDGRPKDAGTERNHGAEVRETHSAPVHKTIRVNTEKLDALMNLFEELVIDRGRLEQIAKDLNHGELIDAVEKLSRVSGDLQSIVLTMRMIPVESVFNRFPKMVRQLARELKKKIELEITGQETELDRTVIDEIGDPLVHLLRNSVDHGIETPEERLAAGKPETGLISLRAFHSGNHVFIEVADDGRGIDREKVLAKAIEKGLLKEEAGKLSEEEVYGLLFHSGFSTASRITDISGRGVGLDVVKNTIESLGGHISVESRPGQGTKFTIQLPLTLSIISVMLVEIGEEIYAIPLTSIIETAIIRQSEIRYAHEQKVIDFRGKVIPVLSLRDIYHVPGETETDGFFSILIVRKGDRLAALVVDKFIGQQEIVLKSLGDYLTNVFAISGATILGDGKVALIVDCNSLIK